VNPATLQSAGLLVLRLVVGTTFLVHGLDKLADLSAAEQFFAAQSIPAPGAMAPFVGARTSPSLSPAPGTTASTQSPA
jgi:uncharacterized membrane protein YphA (DoxX/SURF4 family)